MGIGIARGEWNGWMDSLMAKGVCDVGAVGAMGVGWVFLVVYWSGEISMAAKI